MNFDPRLVQLLKQEKTPFVLSVLAGTLAGGMMLGQADSLSRVVDAVVMHHSTHSTVASLLPVVALFGLFSILRALLNWYSHSEANRGTLAIKKSLQQRLTEKIARLGPLHARSQQSGALTVTMVKGIESLDAYFSQYIPQVFFSLLIPVLILTALFPSDTTSGFILLGSAPLIPVFMIVIGKSAKAMTEKQWLTMTRMSGFFLDMLQGLSTLKLFGRSRQQRLSIEESSEAFRHATMKVLKIAFLSSLALELTGTIGIAAVAISIGSRMMTGAIPFQKALFVLLLAPDFYLPLRLLGTRFHAGMEGISAANSIFAILDRPENECPAQGRLDITEKTAERSTLWFDRVTFRYSGSTVPALDAVSCRIPPGRTTAVVGPSGAGKSTFFNLLLRFADPGEGQILLDSTPLNSYTLDTWHAKIAWVSQQPYLFNASLKENLLLARQGASMRDLQEAVGKAGLAAFISSLPSGLDTMIGEQGTRLSGGEAQRLSLARAFLKDAPILVLDEPTSHTDPVLEVVLRSTMERLMSDRTTIIIAHRLETVQKADQILVFDRGRIVGSGTHDELMQTSGYYSEALLSLKEAEA